MTKEEFEALLEAVYEAGYEDAELDICNETINSKHKADNRKFADKVKSLNKGKEFNSTMIRGRIAADAWKDNTIESEKLFNAAIGAKVTGENNLHNEYNNKSDQKMNAAIRMRKATNRYAEKMRKMLNDAKNKR